MLLEVSHVHCPFTPPQAMREICRYSHVFGNYKKRRCGLLSHAPLLISPELTDNASQTRQSALPDEGHLDWILPPKTDGGGGLGAAISKKERRPFGAGQAQARTRTGRTTNNRPGSQAMSAVATCVPACLRAFPRLLARQETPNPSWMVLPPSTLLKLAHLKNGDRLSQPS